MPKSKNVSASLATARAHEQSILSRIAAAMMEMARERAAHPDSDARIKPIRHIFTRGARAYLWYLTPGMQTRSGTGVLTLDAPQWKLAIARDGVFPSEDEMKLFRKAFGVDGMFFTDTPQIWQPAENVTPPVTRYAFVIRWFAK